MTRKTGKRQITPARGMLLGVGAKPAPTRMRYRRVSLALAQAHLSSQGVFRRRGGDTVGMTGEVEIVHDDGKVTVRLKGYDHPMTVRAEHLNLIAKRGKR